MPPGTIRNAHPDIRPGSDRRRTRGVDRVTSIQYPNETLIQFAYDRAGNRASMVDGTGSTGYSYDALNRLTAVMAGGETVEYGYDSAGNLTTLTYPENGTVQYSYDALNRLEQVADWDDSVIASYSYDDAGRLVGGSYGNGWTFARHFDEANRLDQIIYSSLSTQDYYTFTYELDATGNRIKEITQGGEPQEHDRPERRYLPSICKATSPGPSSFVSIVPLSLQFFERTVEYDYDDIGRLDTTSAGLSDPTYAYDYEYDDAGNRAAEVRPLATRTFDYDDADRLTAVNGQDYTWDEGSLVSDTLRSFEYDGAGRLAQVISGTLTTQYAYNGDGDRVSTTAGGNTVEYTLDPNGLTNVLEARQGVSVTTYLYGLLGPLAEELPSGQRLYYGRDALGSVRFLLDGTGDIVNRYEYDPYGVHHYAESASIDPAFRFGGEQWDAGSGLYYLRARYYDPALGRFLTRDPFAGVLNLPQTLNPYAYVTNNPVNLTDPSGLDPLDEAWRQAFEDTYGREPLWQDRLLRLYALAYPEEWDPSRFYRYSSVGPHVGLYIDGSLEKYLVIVDNIPSSRAWASVPGVLQNLAAWYNEDEAGLFTRDIGTLYGGLQDRFDASAWEAISHPNNPVQVWAYVRCNGLPVWLTGVNDRDANIHH